MGYPSAYQYHYEWLLRARYTIISFFRYIKIWPLLLLYLCTSLSLCVSVRSWGCDTAEHGICSHVALASRPCRCGTSLDFSNWTIIALKQFWFDPMHCENRIRVEEQTPHLFPLYSAPTPKTPAQSLSQVALASDPIMIATAVTTTKGCKNSRISAIRRMPSSSR